MADDISRNTVIVLVVLTLAISMVGTWAVLDEMSRVQPYYYEVELQSSGNVQMSVVTPGDYVDQSPVYDAASAAAVNIVDPEEYNG